MKKSILLVALTVLLPVFAAAQGTAFSFQGRLNDGSNPANGNYDLQFRLYDAIASGAQIGSTVLRPATTLVNGVFSVTLDFGATAFNNPNAVFIDIGVKPAGSPNAFTILGPRQQLTVVPFAVRATNATNADFAANAQNAANATNATNAANAANANTLNNLSSTDFIRNSVSPIANQNFNIVGNGVINGTLDVAGNTTIGGNVAQNRDKNGLVKAMAFIDANGNILRCFNGITGSSNGSCGFTVFVSSGGFGYTIDLGFQADDRFVSVTPLEAVSVNIIATFDFISGSPNKVRVRTAVPDVDFPNSHAANGFMLIVY